MHLTMLELHYMWVCLLKKIGEVLLQEAALVAGHIEQTKCSGQKML